MLACLSVAQAQHGLACVMPTVQPEELQWPWPELDRSPGGTRRLSGDAAEADAGPRPATAGSLKVPTKAGPAGLQPNGSLAGDEGRQPARPQTAGTMRVSMPSSSQALTGLLAGMDGRCVPVHAAGRCMKPLLAVLQVTTRLYPYCRTHNTVVYMPAGRSHNSTGKSLVHSYGFVHLLSAARDFHSFPCVSLHTNGVCPLA